MTLLDMSGEVSRQATWRFDVVNMNHEKLGVLEVDRSSPPTISVDVSRVIKRTLTNVVLVPGEIDNVDVMHNHLHVTMITDDGVEWPQGMYRFTDVSRIIMTSGYSQDIGALSLVDHSLIVDQPITGTVSYGPGTLITDAIISLMLALPITLNIESSGAVISPTAEALSWPPGTSRLRIINELAAMIGYHELFFDNHGVAQLHPMPNPLLTPDDMVLSYPIGGRTYRPSTTRSTNILELPNKFVVVNSGVTNVPIFGVYEVPASAPHSIANRGFEVSHVEQVQGLSSNTDAEIMAEALARSWRFPYETVEFQGPPDPRHDHYNTVDFEGVRFLELSWSMQLSEGSEMSHVIRRTYEMGT